MARSLCPVCGKYVTVARDPDDRSLYLSLHGSWPLCDGSGRYIVDMDRPEPDPAKEVKP